jgi:hypothetical protein
MGHALMENRIGLVVDVKVTHATGTAEREAAKAMHRDHFYRLYSCFRYSQGFL